MKDRSMISKVFCLFLCAALTVGTAVSADGSMLSDGVQTEEVYLSEETDTSEAAEKLFQAAEAVSLLEDPSPVRVGVIDTGFDVENEAIAAKISSDSIKITDAEGNYEALSGNIGEHGTNVAANLAETAGPALDEMVLVDAGNGDGTNKLSADKVVSAIRYLTPRVKVINMSIGTAGTSAALLAAVDTAYQNGVMCLAADAPMDVYAEVWEKSYQ